MITDPLITFDTVQNIMWVLGTSLFFWGILTLLNWFVDGLRPKKLGPRGVIGAVR
jgi:hypothetical protein